MSCLNSYDRFYAWEGGVDARYADRELFDPLELQDYYRLPEVCYDEERIIDEVSERLDNDCRYWINDITYDAIEKIVMDHEHVEWLEKDPDFLEDNPEYQKMLDECKKNSQNCSYR